MPTDATMLSKSFTMIDLTETDDDQTLIKRRPLATNTGLLNKYVYPWCISMVTFIFDGF